MLYLIASSLLVLYLVLEKIIHRRQLNRIPIRIHVNGIRGKSSVVRLIAFFLRQAGIRTVAKVTGEVPTIIYPDGNEAPLPRFGPARIQEQARVVKIALQNKAEALVVECMALEPQLQFASEAGLIRSTIGVITNVRPDHFEVMGETLDQIAGCLSQSIPSEAILLTADRTYYPFFKRCAERLDTEVYLCSPPDTDRKGEGPSNPDFKENTEIAEKLCSLLGIGWPAAGREKNQLEPRSIRSMTSTVRTEGKTLHFIDAFSANDTESASLIQNWAFCSLKFPKPYAALLNNRCDRPLRMRSFVSFLAAQPGYDMILLTGDNTRMAKRLFHRQGARNMIVLKSKTPEKMLEEITRKISNASFTILGMGNYKGIGRTFSEYLRCMAVNGP